MNEGERVPRLIHETPPCPHNPKIAAGTCGTCEMGATECEGEDDPRARRERAIWEASEQSRRSIWTTRAVDYEDGGA